MITDQSKERRRGAGGKGRGSRLGAGVAVALGLALGATTAGAQSATAPASVFVQGGRIGATYAATVGATWESPWRWSLGSGVLAIYGELSASEWSYPTSNDGRRHLTQLAAVPVFRFRGDAGASPWFVEAAVGLSVTDHLYDDGRKQFSTAFNFADHLGVGYDFGARGQHEVALRVEHFSNGGIKEPNPGKTWGQLRYAYRF